MVKKTEYQKFETVKEQIIDNALIFGSVVGFITFGISLFSFTATSFTIGFINDFVILVGLFLTYIFRKKLSVLIKSSIIIVILFLFVFVDIYRWGVYAENKILLVFVPFFSILVFNLRKTIFIFLFASVIYFLFGILQLKGIHEPLSTVYTRMLEIDTWIINLLLIIIVSFIVVIVVNQFNNAFFELIDELKQQNKELNQYRKKLEELVAKRTNELEQANLHLQNTNTELKEKNEIINAQNKDLKLTMQNLKETQTHLVQSEKMASLGILVAGVAHEINNPLNYILGSYYGLEQYFQDTSQLDNNQIKFFLDSIKSGVDKASDIVNGLNQFSRNIDSFEERCDIHSILENCLVILNNKIKHVIEIEREYDSKPIVITGNIGKIHQVFLNIILNAIHSIDKKGKIRIKTNVSNQHHIIEIEDSGCGIPKENLKKIADPFFTTKEPGVGTGLGLSIVYNILKEHSGTIEIKSIVQKGTLVKIKFPVERNNE